MNLRLLIALVVLAAIVLAIVGWTVEGLRWLLRGRSAAPRVRVAIVSPRKAV
jgi:hypothetical protein